MRSPWLQLVLLLLYLLLVIVAAKVLDLVLWYQNGVESTQLMDPLVLSVRQLKLLLDSRGLSYTEYFEKKELVQLLEDSGGVTFGEMDHIEDTTVPLKERLKPAPTSSFFSSGAHFDEEVEDTRDSVWLIQVITSNGPLLDDYSWRLVCSQLEPVAIRIGVFDCRHDRRHCEKKGWQKPLLLLAMPFGRKPKDKVDVQLFTSNKPQVIVDWVRKELSVWVKKVENVQAAKKHWLNAKHNRTLSLYSSKKLNQASHDMLGSGRKPNVKVLFLSQLIHPPLFLASLSIKFTGRIRFGMLSVKKEDSEAILKHLRLPIRKLPCYLVITPETTFVYGKQKLEYLNFQSMNLFLRSIQPEMNDVFLFSFVLVNMVVSLSISMISVQFWWRWTANFLWILVSYNLWLFSAWLLVLGGSRFSVYDIVIDYLLLILRMFGLSHWGSVMRTEWALHFWPPILFAVSFTAYVGLISRTVRKIAPSLEESEPEAWWEVLPADSYWVNYLFRPIASLSRSVPSPQEELENELDLLIERLAVPHFWLQPVIPSDYIKDLPLWQFRGWNLVDECSLSSSTSIKCSHNSPKLLERMMDGEEPGDVAMCHCACLHHRERVRLKDNPKERNNSVSKSDCNVRTHCSCSEVPLKISSSSRTNRCSCLPGEPFHSHYNTCQNIEKGVACERVCEGCCHMSMSKGCPWRDDANNSMSENEFEESERDRLGWKAPEGVLPTSDCAVCLEAYRYGTTLCALPCGHNYHQRCIFAWLLRDNHHCPVCRWPAYRIKIH